MATAVLARSQALRNGDSGRNSPASITMRQSFSGISASVSIPPAKLREPARTRMARRPPNSGTVIASSTSREGSADSSSPSSRTSEKGSLGSSTADANKAAARSRTRPASGPYSWNASALRISTWVRAPRDAFFLSTGGTSTPISFSRKPGVPSACSAYIGWKQPAVSAARAATASSRATIRVLANDIHNPHRNHDYLADELAAEGQFYRIEGQ